MSKRKYTSEVLSPLVRESVSYAEVIRKLGMKQAGGTQANIKRLISAYGLDIGHFTGRLTNRGEKHKGGPARKRAVEVLVERDPASRPEDAFRLRRALLEIGRVYQCSYCGNPPFWSGRPLDLQLDHVNGNRWDNRPENIRFACPNCHSQTETFGAKNRNNKVGKLTVGLTSVTRNLSGDVVEW